MIPIYSPNIKSYTASAIEAINTGWISNHGDYILKSTNKLKELLNIKHIILMANGTCATHCLFLSLKFKYPNISKIYIPNNCYVAAWNTLFTEYSKDIIEVMKMDINTWNINTNEEYILSLELNSAMLIVHNLGNIINVPRLKKLRPDIIFVEDNCEGLFGKYDGIYSGTYNGTLCSSVSFYGNKMITSGEGGAFLTNDDNIFEYISKVYSQGMSSERYLHDTHAFNYRMTNIQAAFLFDQLTDIDNILNNKKHIFNNYEKLFESLINENKIKLFKKEINTESADWIFSVRLIGNNKSKEELYDFFKNNNIDTRPFFYPINTHKHLKDINFDDEIPYILNNEIIMIPSSPTITLEQQKYIVHNIFKCININIFNDNNFIIRNVLTHNVFDLVTNDIVFNLDNKYYNIIRLSVNNFIQKTLSYHNNSKILEIGPKQNENERIISINNILETVDIIDNNNTTYVADISKDNIIPKEYFDAIYCLEVLEHTYEPWEIIKQIYHLLKPNGYLHISVPFQFRLHGPFPDCYRISEFGLKYLLEKNKFRIIEFNAVINIDRPAFPLHYTITCVKQI